ncbi:HHHH-motif protein, partial [Bacillus cereus group sp. BC66]|uniref:HHHH-motif protein n=1 Tax=Bacillus cereus group sp. BC66 TaxID=3445277 RepID=UPI003F69779A
VVMRCRSRDPLFNDRTSNMKTLLKTLTVAALAAAVLVPVIAEAHPHRVCHFEHHHHKVCRWVR